LAATVASRSSIPPTFGSLRSLHGQCCKRCFEELARLRSKELRKAA
jgi:hypothetical protein